MNCMALADVWLSHAIACVTKLAMHQECLKASVREKAENVRDRRSTP